MNGLYPPRPNPRRKRRKHVGAGPAPRRRRRKARHMHGHHLAAFNREHPRHADGSFKKKHKAKR